ncbi:hypothetical protein ACVILI_005833 [Mesorhizobium sp. USDA 4775]|uniref:hypothetical protein n=1 Tax=Mesorhizobium jarvisii TaxID=1777867 RepID=UPI0011DD5745|nr:hypothetical protein [Mesorhizobium jarvisii]MCH4560921.1 hypothetical protein [Mesorhizobium jarvisii]QGU20675.1 hypothetical protein MCHK_09055 [Mesorhizobium huakuii 7653R]
MEKASKSGLCHPKTKHFNPIALPPKTSQWASRGDRAGRKNVASGQQFADAIGFCSPAQWLAALPQGSREQRCLILAMAVLLDSVGKNRQQTSIGRAEIPHA